MFPYKLEIDAIKSDWRFFTIPQFEATVRFKLHDFNNTHEIIFADKHIAYTCPIPLILDYIRGWLTACKYSVAMPIIKKKERWKNPISPHISRIYFMSNGEKIPYKDIHKEYLDER